MSDTPPQNARVVNGMRVTLGDLAAFSHWAQDGVSCVNEFLNRVRFLERTEIMKCCRRGLQPAQAKARGYSHSFRPLLEGACGRSDFVELIITLRRPSKHDAPPRCLEELWVSDRPFTDAGITDTSAHFATCELRARIRRKGAASLIDILKPTRPGQIRAWWCAPKEELLKYVAPWEAA